MTVGDQQASCRSSLLLRLAPGPQPKMSAFGTAMEACDCASFHWPPSRTKHTDQPYRSCGAVGTGKRPPPFDPGDIALDVNVDIVGDRPDVPLPTAATSSAS